MKKGFIYILSNDSLKENLLKIGKTSKQTESRTNQLSSSTSIPEKFKIEAEFEFSDINWAEREIHIRLSKYRPNKRKEFFNCDFNIARQIIVETQIIDKQKEINELKNELKSTQTILNNSKFIKHKWSNFFEKLNWTFTEINRKDNYLLPDFILDTKSLDMGSKGEMEVFTKKTNVYIFPDLPKSSEKINQLNGLNEIIEKSIKEYRLMLVSKEPIEEIAEIIFGWEYNFENENWEERKFIETENKFGIFDEDITWFCIVNGKSVERDGLYPDKKTILELWSK